MLDGRSIPMFGLGVYMMSDEETYDSCKWALEAGYKHIDTAEWYENESMVGKALNEYLGVSSSWDSFRHSSLAQLVSPFSVPFELQTPPHYHIGDEVS